MKALQEKCETCIVYGIKEVALDVGEMWAPVGDRCKGTVTRSRTGTETGPECRCGWRCRESQLYVVP